MSIPDDDDYDIILPPLTDIPDEHPSANDRPSVSYCSIENATSPSPPPLKKRAIKVTRKKAGNDGETALLKQEKRLTAKLAKEREKFEKQRLKNESKALRPKEALKYMRIDIDCRLRNSLRDSKNSLANLIRENLAYHDVDISNSEPLSVENVICWKRRDPNNAQIFISENEYCLIIAYADLNNEQTFASFSRLIDDSRAILKLSQNEAKLRLVFFSCSGTLRTMLDMCSQAGFISFHSEKDLSSLAKFLASYTRSVAERPHKQHKKEALDFLAFAPNSSNFKNDLCNKGSVEAELKYSWRLMLRVACGSKPNAEQASKAICERYPSMTDLLNSYDKLSSNSSDPQKECENMLANLIADLMTKVRIGPAISAAIFRTFTSQAPESSVDNNP